MEKLINELTNYIAELNSIYPGKYDLTDRLLDKLYSVFPFNKFEYVISHLIANEVIDLDRYLALRNSYLERNKFLYVFEITAPRTFGETWAQRHLNELVPELKRPLKSIDPGYSGQYDFWYEGIRIEVKASRAVERKRGESLTVKALSTDSAKGFDMNFQQVKPSCCDVFVWIAVWRDAIRYWVLSSSDVASNPYYSAGQHRGNSGEGQLWLTNKNINEFEVYRVNSRQILDAIVKKGQR